MAKQLGIILLYFIVITPIVIGKKICENTAPLETLFTMDSVTYARKQEMFYRTEISKSLSEGEEKHFAFIFQSASDKLKFVRIDTGFMITTIPKCNATNVNCEPLSKLKGIAFVMGTAKSPYDRTQAYKLYRYSKINRFPALNSATEHMPFNLKSEGEISGNFWPKTASNSVKYLHSTYDERSFTIVHIILDAGNLVLYSYNLKAFPEFTVQPFDQQIKGFFQLMSVKSDDPFNRTAPNSVHVISKEAETDNGVILDFGKDFKLSNSSLSLFDIYGCNASESSTQTTSKGKETTDKQSSVVDTTTNASFSKTDEKTSLGLIIWLLIVLGVVVLTIIAILIVCGIRKKNGKKERSRKVGNASNRLASNASTTGSPAVRSRSPKKSGATAGKTAESPK